MKKLIILILIMLTLGGCGGTKLKLTEREKTITELREKIRTDSTAWAMEKETLIQKIEETETQSTTTNEVTIEEGQTIDIEGDGSGEIAVTETTQPDGTRTIRTTGASSLTIQNENSVQTKQIEELTQKTKSQETTIEKQKEQLIEKDQEIDRLKSELSKKRTTDVKTKRSLIGYLFGGGGVLLLLVVLFLLYRRGKRLGWFARKLKRYD